MESCLSWCGGTPPPYVMDGYGARPLRWLSVLVAKIYIYIFQKHCVCVVYRKSKALAVVRQDLGTQRRIRFHSRTTVSVIATKRIPFPMENWRRSASHQLPLTSWLLSGNLSCWSFLSDWGCQKSIQCTYKAWRWVGWKNIRQEIIWMNRINLFRL